MLQLQDSAAERLRAIEDRLRGLREEKSRAVKVAGAAKATADAVPEGQENDPQHEAAYEALRASVESATPRSWTSWSGQRSPS